MMGLGSMTAQDAPVEGSLKYLVLVNPGSAISARRGEDFILMPHWTVDVGRAKIYLMQDIVDALLDHPSGDTYKKED